MSETQNTALARRTDPITSHEAADKANLFGSRTWVMLTLLEHGPLAPFELEAAAGKLWSPSRIRTALSELSKAGLVEQSGIYRLTRSRFRAQVWQVVA